MALSCAFLAHAQSPNDDKELRVATIERKPFAFQRDGEWTGFSIELWRAIAELNEIKTEFVHHTEFADMLTSAETAQTDAAVANISITHSREQVMDFSQPIFDAGLLVMMPNDSSPSILSLLFRIDFLGWLLSAISLLILAGALIAFCERKSPHFQNLKHNTPLGEGLWWAVNVVTNASFTIFTPITRAGRSVGYGLIVVGLFFVSIFVAQITATLTVSELRSQIDGVGDLHDKRVGTTGGSTSSRFLKTQSIKHKTYATLDDMFAAIENGEVEAVVHDAPILAHYVNSQDDQNFRTVGRVFNPEKYGFVFPHNSSERERFNQGLLRLRESGEYNAILNKWFGSEY